jgi:hypothetical protein
VKAGTENRTKVIAAIALGAVAVLVLVWQFAGWFGGSSSSAAAPVSTDSAEFGKAVTAAPRNPGRVRNAGTKQNGAKSLDPTLRLDLLKSSEDTKYEGAGRNIFKLFVEIPKIITPPVTPQSDASRAAPTPPAPPPPIPLTFYGFATPSGGTKRIFLVSHGEDVFIAKEGDIVDRRYKVVRISQNAVEILDVLSNNRQSIPLTQG